MPFHSFLATLLICILFLPLSSNLLRDKDNDLELTTENNLNSFQKLAHKYGRVYKTEYQFNESFRIYLHNLKLISDRNAAEKNAGGTGYHAMNHLFDKIMTKRSLNSELHNYTAINSTFILNDQHGIPNTVVDWTDIYTTPVKDEMNCWGCWAFPATEQIESDAIRSLGLSTNDVLAVQQLISCCTTNDGCARGTIRNGFEYVKSNGIQKQSTYPLTSPSTGIAGDCHANVEDYVVGLSDYHFLKRNDEIQMANFILSKGFIKLLFVSFITFNFNQVL